MADDRAPPPQTSPQEIPAIEDELIQLMLRLAAIDPDWSGRVLRAHSSARIMFCVQNNARKQLDF